jgi:DNA adenine methylase
MMLKWAGGKTWLTRNHPDIFKGSNFQLCNPNTKSIEFDRYIEPFIGGGAVFKYLNPKKSVISDINNELITYYRCLKVNPSKLYESVRSHFNLHSKEYYYKLRKDIKSDKFEIASRFLYLNYTCFNGIYRVNQKNEFNVPMGDKSNFHYTIDDFNLYSTLLEKTDIFLQDFRKTILTSRKGDLLFVDPPYVTKSNKSTFDKYSPKVFSWKDQEDLAEMLIEKNLEGVKIILTNIDDGEILDLYSSANGWNIIRLNRANILAISKEKKKYKEIVISNI